MKKREEAAHNFWARFWARKWVTTSGEAPTTWVGVWTLGPDGSWGQKPQSMWKKQVTLDAAPSRMTPDSQRKDG